MCADQRVQRAYDNIATAVGINNNRTTNSSVKTI